MFDRVLNTLLKYLKKTALAFYLSSFRYQGCRSLDAKSANPPKFYTIFQLCQKKETLFVQFSVTSKTFESLSSYTSSSLREVSKYGIISGPYFPSFELNTERHLVSLRIQSECGKIRTRNYSVFGHFSRSYINLNLKYYSFVLVRC